MMDFFRVFGLWTSNRPSREDLRGMLSQVSAEVRRLVREGKRPHAIRRFRQETGASLHQALRVVNALAEDGA